jgi:hypothetical protein
MHNGIRTRQYSLEECINCHVAPAADGSYARFGNTEHFCSSCHTYAAVRIDCFQCHADRPVRSSQMTALPAGHPSLAESKQELHERVRTDGNL